MIRFAGKAVLVTGAASGIGRATAARLAAEGASTALADLDLAGAQAAATALAAAHGSVALAFGYNAADPAQCMKLVADAVAALGRLDVLVNNAGIMLWDRTHECDPARWGKVLDVNLNAAFHVTRAALPFLLETKGNIVNISSAAGLQGVPYAAAYCASKAGLLGFTRALAVEYADAGLRVNAICPGAVDTPLIRANAPIPDWANLQKISRLAPKTGKLSDAKEIAAAVAYLASADACNITGIALPVDGGQTAG
ncbi:short-chain dehydrogenase [Acidocella aquatica]|uniref:Short-chain dehydrogenase n=1 Tax=Acidocella aquatica TaxID=1922313 RepID=A0ABQ6A0U2_9PROT|nr:SDR family oxidoreductase [Acidocella aquatica]GLR66054.1 short-chain dehydrogenase [Acidocella aquatica]